MAKSFETKENCKTGKCERVCLFVCVNACVCVWCWFLSIVLRLTRLPPLLLNGFGALNQIYHPPNYISVSNKFGKLFEVQLNYVSIGN